jgi:DNA polymerase III epsilon subunit-like protein
MTLRLPDSLSGLEFAVVDVEGNGRQPPEIVEIAVLPISGSAPVGPDSVRSWLVRPDESITPIVTRRAHGITNDGVSHAPRWDQVAAEVMAAVQGRILVAHNAAVERRVLADHLPGLEPPMIVDTMRLAKVVWSDLAGYGLDRLIAHAGLTRPDVVPEWPGRWRRHRAAYDTWGTAALFARLAAGRAWTEVRDAARTPTATGGRSRPGMTEEGLW